VKHLRDPLLWLIAVFVALLWRCLQRRALWHAVSPVPRPVYQQESFVALTLAHFWLVGVSSWRLSLGWGGNCGDAPLGPRVSPAGGDHCRSRTDLSTGGGAGHCGTGDGIWPRACHYRADLYGVLPILQGTLAGLPPYRRAYTAWQKGWG
jgi:osmoprotectant transport system permease protein